MQFKEKCETVEKCLPESSFRNEVTNLHTEMLAEIERLTALNTNLLAGEVPVCGDCDGTGWRHNRVEDRYACTCMTEAEPYQLLNDALEKINAIRNSIVGTQTVNWSAHVYPLVAALNEAGFVGQEYEDARKEALTLIGHRDRLLAVMQEADDYLDTNNLTNIMHGSVLHRKFKDALAESV